MEFNSEQLKAAYALNLCTVSVSQIIQYEDINIMEQEYEAILNNLNLEQMPKDEALLNILKQILDTITFFRIQDGDKEMIEKVYQQKMKNAIWSAVPNIGMIVAGGNPVTMAVSLASQVGIGYMNYRKVKNENLLENEQQQWQLQRSAIEQFNGLRRELFDTAWRLATVYNFPDQLRLSERQIKQYNDILVDTDLVRKYARLEAIQDMFIAYPPFWYYFGNTANSISRADMNISQSSRKEYAELAKKHFMQYRESNQQGLLREDSISSSCALELIDLLDFNKDQDLIRQLLDEAISYSGRANDILQLATISYLKLNDQENAAKYLNQLVNEQYNEVLNAQLLSSIYVSSYIKNPSEKIMTKYEILRHQIGEEYIYPMPKKLDCDLNILEDNFLTTQKNVLKDKYKLVLKQIYDKYMIEFGKIIPTPDLEEDYDDSYFLDTPESLEKRKYYLSKTFANDKTREEYLQRLIDANIKYSILDVLNILVNTCSELDLVNETVKQQLIQDIKKSILDHKELINSIDDKLSNNTFVLFDMNNLLELRYLTLTKQFYETLKTEITNYCDSRKEMQDFGIAEQNLTSFCKDNHLNDPNSSNDLDISSIEYKSQDTICFGPELLGDEEIDIDEETKLIENINSMKQLINSFINNYKDTLDNVNISIYTSGSPMIERYFKDNKALMDDNSLMGKTLAIIDDQTEKDDFDLILTTYGIIPVKDHSRKSQVNYDEIKLELPEDEFPYLTIGSDYKILDDNSQILLNLCESLNKYSETLNESNSIKVLDDIHSFFNHLF